MVVSPEETEQICALAERMETIWGTPGLAEAIKQKDPMRVVQIAFSKGVKDGDENLFNAAGFYAKAAQRGAKPSEGIIEGEMRRARLRPPQQAVLAKRAMEGDLFAWDICFTLLVVSAYKIDNRPIHGDLYKLAVHAMQGTYRRPTAQGRPKKTIRDQHIAYAVLFVTAAGSAPTRNETSPPHSACDLVAEELVRHRVSLSYSAVETIWKRHSKE